MFLSHLSHLWKWQVGYYSHGILNTLYLVSETCLHILLCTQSGSTQAILKESLKYFSCSALFFIINAFQSMDYEHNSHYFSCTELLLLELSAPAVPWKSKNKWICCNLGRLLNSCGAHSCSLVSYTSSSGLDQRRSALLPCSCRGGF